MANRIAALAALAVAGVLTGCAQEAATGSTARSQGDPQWQEPAAYSFTIDSRCGERAFLGKFQVRVDDHRVHSIDPLDEAADVSPVDADEVPTLAGVIEEAERARERGADKAVVEYDRKDGHPVRLDIDEDRDAIDDESCYTIAGYQPLDGKSSTAWKEPDKYTYTVEAGCGLRVFAGSWQVSVADGKVTRHRSLEKDPVLRSDVRREDVPTLGEVLRDYEHARAAGAHRAKATFDKTDGHPLTIDVDPLENAIDEEFCYKVTGYTVG